jgi:hypothetical protein
MSAETIADLREQLARVKADRDAARSDMQLFRVRWAKERVAACCVCRPSTGTVCDDSECAEARAILAEGGK